jgi:hypothetical protein
MELNDSISRDEPITLNGKPCFCNEGNRLALDYLQAARDALKKQDVWPNDSAIKAAVDTFLDTFLRHCHNGPGCDVCN